MIWPLLAILLLLPLSVGANELDGKSLICDELGVGGDVVGFKFSDGDVFANAVREERFKFRVTTFGQDVKYNFYTTYPTQVKWWGEWVLDRKTLDLGLQDRH